jgi:hypothetical protein
VKAGAGPWRDEEEEPSRDSDLEWGGPLDPERADVRWVRLEVRWRDVVIVRYQGPPHAVTIVLGMLGVGVGALGWQASGWPCGIATMVASLLMVIIYMLLGERRDGETNQG